MPGDTTYRFTNDGDFSTPTFSERFLDINPTIQRVCEFIDRYRNDIEKMEWMAKFLIKNKTKFPLIHIEFISEYYYNTWNK